MSTDAKAQQPAAAPAWAGMKLWASAYRIELILFAVSYVALASFSSQRFLRQSAAPHFIYQAKSWLDGRLDLDASTLPNYEDWACVREVSGVKQRCEGQIRETDHWYVSFPSFPAVVMLPFVAVNGYQFNDTSFGVFIAALAVALFYAWLRQLSQKEGSGRSELENVVIAATLGFGTVMFYCALRGEVWFSAEVMGVVFTCLYARNAVGARRPLLAGVFFSMAVLTRTPLLFSGVFFLAEVLCPTKGKRIEELKALGKGFGAAGPKLTRFAMGAAPLAVLHAAYNQMRFGSVAEFGHRFLYNNRVNPDIDTWGLFHPHYLARNVDAALVMLPELRNGQLLYSPWGMSLLLTLPLLVFVFFPSTKPKAAIAAAACAGAVIFLSYVMPEQSPPPREFPIGNRPVLVWVAVLALYCVWMAGSLEDEKLRLRMLIASVVGAAALAWAVPQLKAGVNDAASVLAWAGVFTLFAAWFIALVRGDDGARLRVPLLVAALACALPGLLYQNTGYAQFGFRFSIDYAPYLLAAFAVSGWSLKHRGVQLALGVGFVVAVWGAVAFRGYTEGVRGW